MTDASKLADIESCPACGALPIDWAGGADPHAYCRTTPDAVKQEDLARLVQALKRIASDHVGNGKVGYESIPANHLFYADCNACHRQEIARAAIQEMQHHER